MLVGVLFVLVGVLFVFSQGNVKHFGARDRPKRYAKKHVGTQKNTSGFPGGAGGPKGPPTPPGNPDLCFFVSRPVFFCIFSASLAPNAGRLVGRCSFRVGRCFYRVGRCLKVISGPPPRPPSVYTPPGVTYGILEF